MKPSLNVRCVRCICVCLCVWRRIGVQADLRAHEVIVVARNGDSICRVLVRFATRRVNTRFLARISAAPSLRPPHSLHSLLSATDSACAPLSVWTASRRVSSAACLRARLITSRIIVWVCVCVSPPPSRVVQVPEPTEEELLAEQRMLEGPSMDRVGEAELQGCALEFAIEEMYKAGLPLPPRVMRSVGDKVLALLADKARFAVRTE